MTEDYVAEILQALADADRMTKAAIVGELEQLRPGYEDAVEVAANALAGAYKAMEPLKSQIAEIDSLILGHQEKADEWQARIDDDDIEQSVTAQFYYKGFADHIAKLQAKRLELVTAMEPVEDEYNRARSAHNNAETELRVFALNCENPLLALGQSTTAYQAFRVGSYSLWVAMLAEGSPAKRSAFFAGLDEIAVRTGYTTDDLKERIRQRSIEQGLQDYRDNFPGAEKSSVPGARDIIDGIHASMRNQFADKIVNRVEDRRNVNFPYLKGTGWLHLTSLLMPVKCEDFPVHDPGMA